MAWSRSWWKPGFARRVLLRSVHSRSRPGRFVRPWRGRFRRCSGAMPRFLERAGCVSCHNNSLTAMTVAEARSRGFRVNEEIASSQLKRIAAFLQDNSERGLENEGIPGGIDTVSYVLLGMAAEKYRAMPSRMSGRGMPRTINLRMAGSSAGLCGRRSRRAISRLRPRRSGRYSLMHPRATKRSIGELWNGRFAGWRGLSPRARRITCSRYWD